MSMEQVRKFAELTQKKRDLEAQLKKVNEELGALEEKVLEYFEAHEIQNVRTDLGTLYLNHEVFASLEGEQEAAFRALRRAGAGWLIKRRKEVSAQTLRAYVKECMKDGGLPNRLQKWVKVSEVYRVRVRSK